MGEYASLMDVFRILEKSNCRQCGEKTCMAFAAAVFTDRRLLGDCPRLPPEVAARLGGKARKRQLEADQEAALADLRSQVADIDLAEAADRVGGTVDGKHLVLRIMGKELRIAGDGRLVTDIHVNPWLAMPVYTYVLNCQGRPLSGRWMPLRELPGGRDWHRLFGQRCEKPMKRVADAYPDLFSDLIELFHGKPVEALQQSDVALCLLPLPLVPLIVCYWQPEEGMDSSLHLFFDASASDNLGLEGLYALGTGITRMLEKIAQYHGHSSS